MTPIPIRSAHSQILVFSYSYLLLISYLRRYLKGEQKGIVIGSMYLEKLTFDGASPIAPGSEDLFRPQAIDWIGDGRFHRPEAYGQ